MSPSSPALPPAASGHWLLPDGVQPEDIDALASFSQAITHDGSTGCWGIVQCECPFNGAAYESPAEWQQRVYDCLWRQNGFPLEPTLDADVLPSPQLSSAAKGDAHGQRGVSDEGALQIGGEDREDVEDGDSEQGSEISEDNEDQTDGDYLEDGQEEMPATTCAGERNDGAEEDENSERCNIAKPSSDPTSKIEAVQPTGPAQLQPGQPDPTLYDYLLKLYRGDQNRELAKYQMTLETEAALSGSRSDTKVSGTASPVPSAGNSNYRERSLPPAAKGPSTDKFQRNSRPVQNTFAKSSIEGLRQKKRTKFDEDCGSDAYRPAFKRVKSHEEPTSMLSTSRKNQSSAQSYPQSYSQSSFQSNPQATSQDSPRGTSYLSPPHDTIDLSNKRKTVWDIKDEIDEDIDQPPIKKAKSTTTAPGCREANSSAADKPSKRKGQSWSDEEGAALYQLVLEQQELEKRDNLKPMRDERLFEKLAPLLQQRMGTNGKSRSPLACKNYWNRIGRARFNCENRGGTKRSDKLVTSAQVSKAHKATQQGNIKHQMKQKSKAKPEESDEDDYEE